MKLTSVELSKEEAEKMYGGEPVVSDDTMPKYPYGLSININDATMKKLGISALPAVGKKMMLIANCEVCSSGESEYQGQPKEMRFELQITEMSLDAPDKQTVIEMASKLYP